MPTPNHGGSQNGPRFVLGDLEGTKKKQPTVDAMSYPPQLINRGVSLSFDFGFVEKKHDFWRVFPPPKKKLGLVHMA